MSRDIFNRDKGVYGRLVLKPKEAQSSGGKAPASGTYTPEPVQVVSKREEAPDTYTLRLKTKLTHDPGQFLQCGILGCGDAAP